jgi:preprotein translocase subunit SecG
MYTAVTIFIIIACLLLTLIVLVQNSKGGGLAAGLSSSNQVMGVRKTTDFLEKFTWGLITSLFILSVVGSFVLPKNQTVQNSSVIQEQIDNTALPSGNMPGPPPAQQQQQQQGQPQPAPQEPAK